jgi:NH3-dependent NAD+ synthetase
MTQDDNKQPSPATLGRYRQLLAEARNDDERRRVLGALGGCDSVAALDLAVAQLATPNLRAEAELALKNVAELVKKHHPKEAKAALQKLQAR